MVTDEAADPRKRNRRVECETGSLIDALAGMGGRLEPLRQAERANPARNGYEIKALLVGDELQRECEGAEALSEAVAWSQRKMTMQAPARNRTSMFPFCRRRASRQSRGRPPLRAESRRAAQPACRKP